MSQTLMLNNGQSRQLDQALTILLEQRVKGIDFHPTEPWILSSSPSSSTGIFRL